MSYFLCKNSGIHHALCPIPGEFRPKSAVKAAFGKNTGEKSSDDFAKTLSVAPCGATAPPRGSFLRWRESLQPKRKVACPGVPLPSCRCAAIHLPQGDGFSGSGKVSGITQRRPLGGAGCERSEQTEGVLGLTGAAPHPALRATFPPKGGLSLY